MAKGMLEKVVERALTNAAGVLGRKMANTLADKAQTQIEKRNVAQSTQKAPETVDDSPENGEPDMID